MLWTLLWRVQPWSGWAGGPTRIGL